MKHHYTLAAALTIQLCAHAQAEAPRKELPLVGVGAGICSFSGDVGKGSGFQTSLRPCFNAGIEQRFGNFAGAGISLYSGSLSSADRSQSVNRNFRSSLLQAGINGIFYFDNDALMKRAAQTAPWISVGFHYLKFDPYGDMKDANGRAYYYWSDGSIRDRVESPANEPLAVMLHRDYTYETQLKDSAKNYTRSTFALPLGAGVRFRFGKNFSADLAFHYNITFSDYLDNVASGGNDAWMYFNAGINYTFTAKHADNTRYNGVDFSALDNQDYDADGVADNDDQCPGTPARVKVDAKGCPLDGDNDGVPDYRDKEAATPAGAPVDEDGVSLDAVAHENEPDHDSLAAARRQQFGDDPSRETLDKISGDAGQQKKSGSTIPEQFRAADLNSDGFISADEITKVIDMFFDGEGDWTAEKINRLIDYFFEQ